MANHLKVFASLTGLVVLLAGCVNLKAPPDPTRYYLLNGTADVEALANDVISSGPIVRVASVDLDLYLDSRYMVLRLQEFEVQFSDVHRWGEELSDNIQRALARDLLATGAASDVVTNASRDADYVVRLHVHRFEGVPPDIAHLSATWSLVDRDGTLVYSTVHDDRNTGWVFENYGHLAEKLDESLATLARAMADKIPK